MSAQSPETFQIPIETAEAYEATFVPALFADWAPHVVDAAMVAAGDRVLDVACGTGVVAREALARVGPDGRVVGVDLNDAILTVARRVEPRVEWRRGDAGDLPVPDASFDVVVCQSALMFFPDRPKALREMARVVTDGGTVCVQAWNGLDQQPAYGPLVEVAARHAGPDAVNLLSTYWVLGEATQVVSLFEAAGLDVTTTTNRTGTARFESIDAFVRTEVDSTPLVERITPEIYARMLVDAHAALAAFNTPAGTAEIPLAGYIVTGRRR